MASDATVSSTSTSTTDRVPQARTHVGTAGASWQDAAACKGKTLVFFGPPGERPGRRLRRERAAKTICHGCPVLLQCRESARELNENGIWGGETEEERAAAGFAPRAITRRAVAGARRSEISE